MYDTIFQPFSTEKNSIILNRDYIGFGTIKLVDDYLDLLYGSNINFTKRSTLSADIINRKLTRILMGVKVSNKNNLDIVEHGPESDRFLTNRSFLCIDTYVRRAVKELTGITYTEYKQMTPIERVIFDAYLTYKMEVANLPIIMED